jgi:cyanate lyase
MTERAHWDLSKQRSRDERADLTDKILDIKREKGWTPKAITHQIGRMSPRAVAGAFLGRMKLVMPVAGRSR